MQESPSIIVHANAEGRQEVELLGDLNICMAADLHRECLRIAQQGQDTTLDCRSVSSFDAAALQILLALKEALTSQNKKLRWFGLSAELEDSLEAVGMKKHLISNDNL